MRRTALVFIGLALSAQTPEPNVIQSANEAWNSFAIAGNDWRVKHRDYIWSREDHQRLQKARSLWRQFDRLAKEAQF